MRKFLSFVSKKNPNPLFILGNPKSGTTVIAKLLSKATNQSLTSDIKSITKYAPLLLDFELLHFEDFIKEHAREFSRDIIKEPSLSFVTDKLMKYYPNSRYIWIVRSPYQNIRSILNRLKIPGDLRGINFDDFIELQKTPAWKLNLQSKMFGYKSKNYIEALAYRWNHAFNIYLQNKKKIELVKYEDFLKDKKKFIEELVLKLEFSIENDISSYVNVQYQPKGNSNIDLKNFFGAENYSIIQDICKNNMKKLGYTN